MKRKLNYLSYDLIPGNGLIDENDFMQWVTKIQAIQGMDVSTCGGDSEEEITRDLLAAFKYVSYAYGLLAFTGHSSLKIM